MPCVPTAEASIGRLREVLGTLDSSNSVRDLENLLAVDVGAARTAP
jgi:hypothetical protein